MPGPPVTVVIPGVPVAKGRPRVARIGGGVRAYTPKRTKEFEEKVAACFRAADVLSHPLEGPVSVQIQARYPAIKPYRKRNPRPPRWKDTGPDVDNVVKAVLDGLNGLAYQDDRQVCRLLATKVHVAQGDEPCVVVSIDRLGSSVPFLDLAEGLGNPTVPE